MVSVFDQGQTRFDNVDGSRARTGFSEYLSRMAVEAADMKHYLHDLLDPVPGDNVLDVGCGTGVDVLALAERVAPDGRVAGIDNSSHLIETARAESHGAGDRVEFRVADVHDLPFGDSAFTATRAERVMMHVADPDRALGEMVRVTKPGGRVLVADPDHGMWALDSRNIQLTRRILTWWFDAISNPWAARQMRARFAAAGLGGIAVSIVPITLLSRVAANAMTGIDQAARTAADEGVITAEEAREFDEELAARQDNDAFFMCGAIIATVGEVAG
jgi:ubiquinone/menaquinone biosynthesis C-methylase UbiE